MWFVGELFRFLDSFHCKAREYMLHFLSKFVTKELSQSVDSEGEMIGDC